jgi:hypothetical protein
MGVPAPTSVSDPAANETPGYHYANGEEGSYALMLEAPEEGYVILFCQPDKESASFLKPVQVVIPYNSWLRLCDSFMRERARSRTEAPQEKFAQKQEAAQEAAIAKRAAAKAGRA